MRVENYREHYQLDIRDSVELITSVNTPVWFDVTLMVSTCCHDVTCVHSVPYI